MNKKHRPKGTRRVWVSKFQPNSEYIQDAMDEYPKKGGRITRLNIDSTTLENSLLIPGNGSDTSEFLGIA